MKQMFKQFKTISGFFLGLALAAFFSMTAAQAAVPYQMNYQGLLKDGSGNYLTGTYSMVFRIYSVSSGGTAAWTETQSSVSVASGKFSVTLGSVTPLNIAFNQDLWLSIQVGSDAEMSPRIKLTSVGYAYMAQQVVDGFTQSQHDSLSHRNVEGVRSNTEMIAKTNFKIDAYSSSTANSMGDMIVDTFTDASGIASGSSTGYTWRGSSNYDVVVTPSNPVDSNTKLLLHANGANNSTTFTDSGSTGFAVTAYGDAKVSTAQSKFGGASAALDGAGDYIGISDNDAWQLGGGTGDFAIDFWFRFNSIPVDAFFIGQQDSSTDRWGIVFCGPSDCGSNIIEFFNVSSGITNIRLDGTPSTINTNTWYHLAVTRSGSTFKMFLNGTQIGTTTDTDAIGNYASALNIGRRAYDNSNFVNGYIDEIRISNVSRWTSGFTAPSSEYGAVSGSDTATVVSTAFGEASAPAEAMITPSETLNTGSIAYYVSRDNGTTWTSAPKNTVVSISSQPSGTQLKWKAVLTGDAELDGIALSV